MGWRGNLSPVINLVKKYCVKYGGSLPADNTNEPKVPFRPPTNLLKKKGSDSGSRDRKRSKNDAAEALADQRRGARHKLAIDRDNADTGRTESRRIDSGGKPRSETKGTIAPKPQRVDQNEDDQSNQTQDEE